MWGADREVCSFFIDGFCCPAGTAFRLPAKFGTPVRRAARRGRLWGYAPFSAPLASPPKHPLRKFSIAIGWRGHASCAAGASLPRCARSGDLPPRRVNAIVRFRSDQSPLQPKYRRYFCMFRAWRSPFSVTSKILIITRLDCSR